MLSWRAKIFAQILESVWRKLRRKRNANKSNLNFSKFILHFCTESRQREPAQYFNYDDKRIVRHINKSEKNVLWSNCARCYFRQTNKWFLSWNRNENLSGLFKSTTNTSWPCKWFSQEDSQEHLQRSWGSNGTKCVVHMEADLSIRSFFSLVVNGGFPQSQRTASSATATISSARSKTKGKLKKITSNSFTWHLIVKTN